MGKFGAFGYSVDQGIKNIRRNKLFSIASMATMALCIFLFGVLYFVMANVQNMIKEAESGVGVTVFFNEGIAQERIEEIGNEIREIKGVSTVNYLNAEDTWAQYKESYLNPELAASFGNDNPLSNSMSYTVYFDDVSYETDIVTQIEAMPGVRKVNNANDVVNTLTKINRALQIGTVLLVGLLLSIASFLISTTITVGVSIRQKEISIMHLIGATDLFIKGPFLIEGLIIGLIGVCVPLSVLYAVYYKIVALVVAKFSGMFLTMNFVTTKEIFIFVLPVSLIIGLGIGLSSSYFTLRRQLAQIRSN
ncbi:MAG: permease-like cell division protein FtsX [Lachnospiraceae bacterium]|nr:permease-like cell division protein FtsX [Lachnospiraceae bacterium]